MKAIFRYVFVLTYLTFSTFSIKAQTDTFSVQFPEFFEGLNDMGVSVFQNTCCFSPLFEKVKYEFVSDVLKKYPATGTPIVFKLAGHWYVTYQGAGIVLQLSDDFKKAIRIDNTIHAGYNYGQTAFIWHSTICTFGGYGFWNINGVLRSYSSVGHTWEPFICTYSQNEFGSSSNYSFIQVFYDQLYVGRVHESTKVTNKNTDTDKCYKLDDKGNWIYIGKINPILDRASFKNFTNRGTIVANDIIYRIDFLSNTIYKLSSKNFDGFITGEDRHFGFKTYYIDSSVIAIFDCKNHTWEKIKLQNSDWTLVNSPLYTNDDSYTLIISISLICLIVFIAIVYGVRRMNKKQKAHNAVDQMPGDDLPETNGQISIAEELPDNKKYWFETLGNTEKDLLIYIKVV